MRTNVTLNSDLVKSVQKITGSSTKGKAVVIALEEFIRWRKISTVAQFKGKLKFASHTAISRHHER